MAEQTKNFFITGIDNLPDPVRNTRWKVLIPDTIWNAVGIAPSNAQKFTGPEGANLYSLHIKTAKIPEITISEGAHHYMGFISNYPINAKLNGEMPFSTILLEDMAAYEMMVGWNNACLNSAILMPGGEGAESGNAGGQTDRMTATGIAAGLGVHKNKGTPDSTVLRNQSIDVVLYNWMTGTPLLTVTLHNAWPKAVSGFDLTYKEAALVEFNFTLIYDRWTVKIAKPYSNARVGTKE